VEDKVAKGEGFPPSTSALPVNIIPLLPHAPLNLRVAFIRRTSMRGLETFQEALLFRKFVSFGRKSTITEFVLYLG
jgi:hypothetical protein